MSKLLCCLLSVMVLAGCRQAPPPPSAAAPRSPVARLTLSSPAFEPGASLPAKYTADGENLAPPLKWSAPPAGTRALALVLEDPDAPGGSFTHWLVYDLPATATELTEGTEANAQLPNQGGSQGTNDFGKVGYGGPEPPPGAPHHYRFTLYALDAPTGLEPGCHTTQVRRALEGHIQARAELTVLYGR